MVYVDNFNTKFGNMIMSHMIADTNEELYEMADKIGVKRKWKHNNHFDVCLSKKKLAIENGAVELPVLEFAKKSLEIKKRIRRNEKISK